MNPSPPEARYTFTRVNILCCFAAPRTGFYGRRHVARPRGHRHGVGGRAGGAAHARNEHWRGTACLGDGQRGSEWEVPAARWGRVAVVIVTVVGHVVRQVV